MSKTKQDYIRDVAIANDNLIEHAKKIRPHDWKIDGILITTTLVKSILENLDGDATLKDFEIVPRLIALYDNLWFNQPRNKNHLWIIQRSNAAWTIFSLIFLPLAVLTYLYNTSKFRKASGGKYGVCNLGLFNERTRSSTLANALLYQIEQPVDNQKNELQIVRKPSVPFSFLMTMARLRPVKKINNKYSPQHSNKLTTSNAVRHV